MKQNSLKTAVSLINLLLLLSITSLLKAQAPANDNCTGAILVATSPYDDLAVTYTNGNTTTATRSIPNPGCVGGANDNNDDIWYSFVAQTQTELLRVHSVVAGSSYVTLGYALYDGCGGTEITCNSGMATFYGNEMLGGLTPGNTYYLRFWAQGPFTAMTFSFAVMDITPQIPGNELASATLLNINAPGQHCITPQFYTTASATRSSPNPSCNNNNDDDVWFQFTCPANTVNIYPEEGALISTGGFANMGLEIIDGTAGVSVSCTANYGVGSTTLLSGIVGHIYYIRIWTMGTTDRAVFSLCLQNGYDVSPSHVNNTCSTATDLTVGAGTCTNSVTGNLLDADLTAALTGNPSCTINTTLKNDVWYKATVPASGNLVVQTSATHSAVNDLVLLAYTNNCNTYTQITCDEDGNTAAFPSANHARISLTARTPGEIIYFRVLPRNIDNMGQFSICAFDETAAALPSVSITDVKLNEGNSGTKQFDFTVSLSSASLNTVSVKYRTVDVSATGGVDYVAVPTKTLLTFNPGETAKTVSITVNGDTSVEAKEIFKVNLTNPVNAVIADNSGKGTIKNDDGPVPAVSAVDEEDDITAQSISKIRIYPNPVTDKMNIELPVSNSRYTITIMDITGRFIKQLTVAPNQKNVSVNTASLSRGSYLVKIESFTDNISLKFIKQ
ncbi:MAG: Calx-beta domain-containing protein [Panacibacter sp.]